MLNSKRLVLAHFWLAFAAFGIALLLGAWQMYVRSPLHPWLQDAEIYYRSVTAHGTAMGYVFPTLDRDGLRLCGQRARAQAAADRTARWAWLGFALVAVGAVVAMVPVAMGLASVLYTFYPPMIGSAFYYIGVVLVVVGSWIWVALMVVNLHAWKREHPGRAGAARDVRDRRPARTCGRGRRWALRSKSCSRSCRSRFGLKSTIDAGLARVLFSWTLHAIVYFWLMPAYIAYYTIIPRAIGGRLYSDSMARISFILFLVFSMPIGIHHLFADPQVGSGFKFMHSVFTAHGRGADAADRVHDLRVGRDRGTPARRQGRARLDRAHCRGTTR